MNRYKENMEQPLYLSLLCIKVLPTKDETLKGRKGVYRGCKGVSVPPRPVKGGGRENNYF